jgi:hypothetical protein
MFEASYGMMTCIMTTTTTTRPQSVIYWADRPKDWSLEYLRLNPIVLH